MDNSILVPRRDENGAMQTHKPKVVLPWVRILPLQLRRKFIIIIIMFVY